MTLYSAPPAARIFLDDKPTLLVSWWCSLFAATVIIFRICGRYIRTEKLFTEDWIAFLCLIPLFIRMGLVHVVLLYGTNNVIADGLSDLEVQHRQIGSKLVLASRIFYAATLWMLKLTITEFFKRLTIQIWRRSYEITLRSIRWFLLITFVAVVLADICECQPISHYWQVTPDPGPKCRQAYAQLLTMGIANVITDLLLVIFPIPIILRSQMSMKRKFQLVCLFGGSILPAIVTLYRIPNIIDRAGSQPYRSLWASIEILLATAVANALVLGSFVRDRGVKKAKWKFGSMSDSMERTTPSRRGTAIQHWGSDEDLVRDMGLGMVPELRDAAKTVVPRPAPMAISENMPEQKFSIGGNWRFPSASSGDGESEESDILKYPRPAQSSGDLTPTPKRTVSFFDIGGLLEDDLDNQPRGQSIDGDAASLAATRTSDSNSLSPTTTRKGSAVFLQDVGGLLTLSPPQNGHRSSRYTRSSHMGMELESIPQERSPQRRRRSSGQELQDVGGLLK